jgi:hypothetical protein
MNLTHSLLWPCNPSHNPQNQPRTSVISLLDNQTLEVELALPTGLNQPDSVIETTPDILRNPSSCDPAWNEKTVFVPLEEPIQWEILESRSSITITQPAQNLHSEKQFSDDAYGSKELRIGSRSFSTSTIDCDTLM